MILKHFIVFEGLDGSGTTTQGRLLAQRLNGVFTFEPSDNAVGTLIRQILRKEKAVLPQTLSLMFTADRYEHLFGQNGIEQQIKDGKTVVCDRYLFSSLAYQSLDCDFDEIYQLNKDFPLPEIVFFIDTPVEECLRRIGGRGAAPELFERAELQRKIYDNYLRGFAAFSQINLVKLDGMKSVDELLQEELKIIGK